MHGEKVVRSLAIIIMFFQLGMLAQSGDFFDIWGMVAAGSAPESHGNAGTGTYIVQIGQRDGNYHFCFFSQFKLSDQYDFIQWNIALRKFGCGHTYRNLQTYSCVQNYSTPLVFPYDSYSKQVVQNLLLC